MSTEITFDIAKEKFPFLESIQPQHCRHSEVGIQVKIVDYARLILEQPSTLEDNTIHHGFECHELLISTGNGALQIIDICFGQVIIYQARNMNPWEERDDVYESGESIGEALVRCDNPVKFIVLHSWGRTRSSRNRGKALRLFGDDYEIIKLAVCP